MNKADWHEQHQILDAQRIRLLNQRTKLVDELERLGKELSQIRKAIAEHYTIVIKE